MYTDMNNRKGRNFYIKLSNYLRLLTFRKKVIWLNNCFISYSITSPRRPGFKPGSGHVGFCDRQKWRWGRFSPRTSVSPANLHSICFSTIIFTITRSWHNRPGRSGRSPNNLTNRIIKKIQHYISKPLVTNSSENL
jgi:hypothetical protein